MATPFVALRLAAGQKPRSQSGASSAPKWRKESKALEAKPGSRRDRKKKGGWKKKGC